MFRTTILLAGAILGAVTAPAEGPGTAESTPRVSVIVVPVSGPVDPGMAAFVGRALRDGLTHPNPVFLLEMDTFGGRVDAAFEIVDTMLTVPEATTIAYVKKRAISAGALIALSCGRMAMKPNTTIGDCAPIAYSNDGPEMLGEKFQSPLRAKFRALAKRNNYPPALAEAMVTAEMAVYRVGFPDTVLYLDSLGLADLPAARKKLITARETVVAPGELLTMDDQEARDLGFSQTSAPTVEQVLEILGITNYELISVEESWSEKFVGFVGTIAPILMMIGFAAIYTELKTPGFGVPGIVGIVCLSLVFGSQYMVGLADYTELLFLVAGVMLLGVEIFVTPGFGMVGIAGIMLMAVGMMLSLQGFVLPRPEFPWQRDLLERNVVKVLLSLVGSVALIVIFFKYAFPRLGMAVSGPYLVDTLAQSHVDSELPATVKVGDTGVVVNPLRPSGKARFGTEIVDVVTEGEFMDRDDLVTVTDLSGNRIVVTRAEAQNG